MTQGDTPRCRVLAVSIMLGLGLTAAHAQIPGDSPGGAPQYRDQSGVLQPGSGAAGTTTAPTGTWTPAKPSNSSAAPQAPAQDGASGNMQSPASTVPSTPSPAAAPSPAMDGASSPRSALSNDQAPLPSEPTAAGPGGPYGGYDPARESWIPYTSSGYIGVSGGKPDLKTACAAGLSCDDPDSAWSVYLGGQFNPYLGLQLGYLQLQDADRNGGDTKVRGVNISLTGALPLGSNFSLNGRVGGTYGWTKTTVGAAVTAPSGNEEGFGVAYGVGASWDFDRHWSVTVDWDRHRLKFAGDEKKNTDIASVGLRYRF
ncbi:porin family protein [Aquabacterium soli]|uniref:Porin family protein n=2 Tax=Aquabacterium soli TaxID=2493092 RepID=A0A3R8T6H5_9BURK|nr:porin family protein [Aquabacterium soli]